MISFFGKGPRSLVGLDIGSSSVKAVELRPAAQGYAVAAMGAEPLPAAAVVDGAVANRQVVADAVRKVMHEQRIETRDVALSIAGSGVIVKRLRLPTMSPRELAGSMYWEARQCIPFDVEDVRFDYQVLDAAPSAMGASEQNILLVAAKKHRITEVRQVVEMAGCVPVVMDVDAFAVQNAYELNHGFDALGTVVLLNIGASVVNVNIIHGNLPVFTRDVAIGGNAYTDALGTELGLPFEDAERLKTGVPVDGLTYRDARPVVRAVSDNLVVEIAKTIDFFRATAFSDELTRVVLSGGTSRVEGLAEALRDRLAAPVEMLDPFRQLAADGPATGHARCDDLSPVAAVAVGLAMRRVDDRGTDDSYQLAGR